MYKIFLIISFSICSLSLSQPAMSEKPEIMMELYAGIRFVRIPAGCFKAEYILIPEPLCLQSFYMGQYEITREQWRKVMKTTISKGPIQENGKINDAQFPADYMSWDGAQQFIAELNKHSKNYKFKLPTEMQWQYACLGGQEKPPILTGRHGIGLRGGPMPVGSYPPNQYGLYDMNGNVWEWINDFYFTSYYQMPQAEIEKVQNPETVPETFQNYKVDSLMRNKVIRGGSWFNESKQSDCGYRYYYWVNKRSRDLGFRIIALEK